MTGGAVKEHEIRDCVVVAGRELMPRWCRRFAWRGDTITAIEAGATCTAIDGGAQMIFPGLYNCHTHLGDSVAPDGATGLTLEEGFFRPNGYKYRMLAEQTEKAQVAALVDHQRYMASCGVVAHIDFREQGPEGARRLRVASGMTGVDAIILSQFSGVPFEEGELERNAEVLPREHRAELEEMLSVADGFSESTMNDLTEPAWREVRALTAALGKYRAIHCLENRGYRDVSVARTGRGDLERAIELLDPHLIVHMTVAEADEIRMLAASGKTAVLNPRANAALALPLPPVAALLRSGVNLLVGTDNGLLNSPNLFAELDFTYRLARSQSGDIRFPEAAAVLSLATSNVTSALGGDHHGHLAEGLPATFAIADMTAGHLRWSRNPLATLLTRVTPRDIRATYRVGRCLYSRDGAS